MVLSAVNQLSVVQQVIELTAVNLIERDVQAEVLIALQEVADVKGGKQVESWIGPVGGAHHGEGLPTPSLTISKASGIGTMKSAFDQGLDANLINLESKLINSDFTYLIIISLFIKHIVKIEIVLLNVLCQVHFIPREK